MIVGARFGGHDGAGALRRQPVDITLFDRREHQRFQRVLQVATTGLSRADIASPTRAPLRHQPNVRVVLGEARGIDATVSVVDLADGGNRLTVSSLPPVRRVPTLDTTAGRVSLEAPTHSKTRWPFTSRFGVAGVAPVGMPQAAHVAA